MEKFNKKYKKVRQIGSGSFGKIFLVHNRQEDRLAVVKVVDISSLNDLEAQAVLNEIKIMELLEHPYTVKIFDHLILQKSISIVMQYAEGRLRSPRRRPRSKDQSAKRQAVRQRRLLSLDRAAALRPAPHPLAEHSPQRPQEPKRLPHRRQQHYNRRFWCIEARPARRDLRRHALLPVARDPHRHQVHEKGRHLVAGRALLRTRIAAVPLHGRLHVAACTHDEDFERPVPRNASNDRPCSQEHDQVDAVC